MAFLQCLHSLLISLWAIIAFMEAGSKKAGIHIFKIRVSVSAAEFVCIVESTRCHVKDASIAIFIVSLSRISHTIIMSGSWRKAVRKPDANEYPISGNTWLWFTQSRVFSTGSSSVIIFTSGVLRFIRQEYSVVDLPDHVGPEVRTIQFGWEMAFSRTSQLCHSIHRTSRGGTFLLLSTIRITIFSQWTVGKVETRRSSHLSFMTVEIRPSWGILDSSILRLERILYLATIWGCMKVWYSTMTFNIQSTLNLTRTTLERGSICISELQDSTADAIIRSQILCALSPLYISSFKMSNCFMLR